MWTPRGAARASGTPSSLLPCPTHAPCLPSMQWAPCLPATCTFCRPTSGLDPSWPLVCTLLGANANTSFLQAPHYRLPPFLLPAVVCCGYVTLNISNGLSVPNGTRVEKESKARASTRGRITDHTERGCCMRRSMALPARRVMGAARCLGLLRRGGRALTCTRAGRTRGRRGQRRLRCRGTPGRSGPPCGPCGPGSCCKGGICMLLGEA